MNDVVKRLKKSKAKSRRDDAERGSAAGRRWAEGTAEWSELERLHRVSQAGDSIMLRMLDPSNSGLREMNYGSGEAGAYIVLSAIVPEEELRGMRNDDRRELVERVFGVEDENDVSIEFAEAFVQAALEVFDAVEDEVEEEGDDENEDEDE